jgi:hypothetical protein
MLEKSSATLAIHRLLRPNVIMVANYSPLALTGKTGAETPTQLSQIVRQSVISRMNSYGDMHVVVPITREDLASGSLKLNRLFTFEVPQMRGEDVVVTVHSVQDPNLDFNLYVVSNPSYIQGSYYGSSDELIASQILNRAALRLPREGNKFSAALFHLLGKETSLFPLRLEKRGYPEFRDTRVMFDPLDVGVPNARSAQEIEAVIRLPRELYSSSIDEKGMVQTIALGMLSPRVDRVIILTKELLARIQQGAYGDRRIVAACNQLAPQKLTTLFDQSFPQDSEEIALAYIDAMRSTLRGRIGRGPTTFTLPLHDHMQRAMASGEVSLANFFMNLRGWEPGRAPVMTMWLNTSDDVVLANTERNRVMAFPPETRRETGSSILGIATELVKADPELKGRSVIALNGGLGTRLGGVTLAEAGIKGNTEILGRKMLVQAAHQSLPIFAQLPRLGEGQVIIAGCDNIMLTSELMVGDHPLAEDKRGIRLFAPYQNVQGENDSKLFALLKGKGLLFVDPSGKLIFFEEKMVKEESDIGRVRALCRQTGSQGIFINTFYMMVSAPALKRMVQLYSQPSVSSNQPLQERDIDWSSHIITPMTVSKEDWQKRYAVYLEKCRDPKKPKSEQYILTRDEWDQLYVIAQALKDEFGIGVVNIGKLQSSLLEDGSAMFFDTGDPSSTKTIHEKAITGPREEREIIRKHFGVPSKDPNTESTDVILSEVGPDIELPKTPGSFLIYGKARLTGKGKVNPGTVIIGSEIENPEVRDGNVIVNSSISGKGEPPSEDCRGNLLYNFTGDRAYLNNLEGQVIATVHTQDGPKTGHHPISGYDPDKTPIAGIGTFSDLLDENAQPPKSKLDLGATLNDQIERQKRLRKKGK